MTNQRLLASMAICVLGIPATVATAQTTPIFRDSGGDEAPNGIEIADIFAFMQEETQVAAKKAQTRSEAPAHVLVIGREAFERLGYRHLRDVLEDLPGIQVTKQSNAKWGTWLFVRGLPGNHRVVFLLDGHRLNPAGGEEVPLFANMPIAMIKRVEMMYGPGGALYGSDAFSGVVNIVTRAGDCRRLEASSTMGTSWLTDSQLYASYCAGGAELFVGGNFAYRQHPNLYEEFAGEYSYPLAGGDLVRLDKSTSPGLDLSRFAAPEWGYDFYAGGAYQGLRFFYYRRGYELSSAWEGAALASPFVDSARLRDTQGLAVVSLDYELGDIELRSIAEYASYGIGPPTAYVSLQGGPSTWASLTDRRRGGTTALRAEQYASYAFSQIDLELSGGLLGLFSISSPIGNYREIGRLPVPFEYSYHLYTGTGDRPPVGAGGEVQHTPDTAFSAPIEVSSIPLSLALSGGAYAQLLWQQLDWLQVTAGIRIDFSERFGATVNPRVTLVSEFTEGGTIKVLYARGHLEPTPSEQFGTYVDSSQLFAPNPDLVPERLDAFEINWLQRLPLGMSLELSAFLNIIDNIINPEVFTQSYVYIPGAATSPEHPGFYEREFLQTLNGGEGVYYGGEAQVSWRYLEGPVRFWVDADLSFVDGRREYLERRGERASGPAGEISPWVAKFKITVQPLDRLNLSFRGEYRTPPRLSFSTLDYPAASPAIEFFVGSAHVSYRVDKLLPNTDVTFFVTVNNFADARFKTGSSRPGINPVGTPQPSLRFFSGLRAELDLGS